MTEPEQVEPETTNTQPDEAAEHAEDAADEAAPVI
jgi:hypothetical protein